MAGSWNPILAISSCLPGYYATVTKDNAYVISLDSFELVVKVIYQTETRICATVCEISRVSNFFESTSIVAFVSNTFLN